MARKVYCVLLKREADGLDWLDGMTESSRAVESAMKMIAGSARSMGVEVVG